MDHICYRTRTQAEYNTVKTELESIGTLLVESNIGGRLISTYRLAEALDVSLPKQGVSVQLCVVEIPSPKLHSKRDYPAGLEHVEFVVPSLAELETRFPNLQWDKTGLKKETNADLRLDFDGFSVKFHEQPLEKVIEQELLARRY